MVNFNPNKPNMLSNYLIEFKIFEWVDDFASKKRDSKHIDFVARIEKLCAKRAKFVENLNFSWKFSLLVPYQSSLITDHDNRNVHEEKGTYSIKSNYFSQGFTNACISLK